MGRSIATNFDIAVISLFKAVAPTKKTQHPYTQGQVKALKHGVYITDEAVQYLSPTVVEAAIKAFGYDLVNLNKAALHKSFKVVNDTSVEDLFVQQTLHYMSVYMQTDSEWSTVPVKPSLVYIPTEELKLPKADPISITVISVLSDMEIINRAKKLMNSGMALTKETQEHLLAIVRRYEKEFSLDDTNNKEFRVRLMDTFGMMPKRAGEFLRYLVYKKTGNTLMMNTRDMIGAVRANESWNADAAFKSFIRQNGVEAIAEQFNRFKDFWLAFKKDGKFVSRVINKARKLSVTMNKPMVVGVLDRIGDKDITLDEVKKELKKVSLFKKVSVANSMRRRAEKPAASMFTVRNGRSFARAEENAAEFMTQERSAILSEIMNSIVEEIRPAVQGKKIYIPDDVDYAFPTSEKMFVGNVPFMSTLSLDKNAIVGVHWENLPKDKYIDGGRLDLDLHYVSANNHVGWCNGFGACWEKDVESVEKSMILHSGDMVDAPPPNGATEALYVPEEVNDDFASINLNMYTYFEEHVPFTLFAGKADRDHLTRDYLVGAHNLCVNVNGLEMVSSQESIGFLESSEDGKKLHFFKSSSGTSIVSAYNEHSKNMIEAVKSMLRTRLSLKEVLALAGAVFALDENVEDDVWDMDLSLDKLTSDSFTFLTAPIEEDGDDKPKEKVG